MKGVRFFLSRLSPIVADRMVSQIDLIGAVPRMEALKKIRFGPRQSKRPFANPYVSVIYSFDCFKEFFVCFYFVIRVIYFIIQKQ
jgi:hypothetical protein